MTSDFFPLLRKEAISFTFLMNRVDETPDCMIIDFSFKTLSSTAIHSKEIWIHSFHERHMIDTWYSLFGS